ncbi:DUF4058 family protein [Leptothoe kymatousa]|uniref:DUF4058 family protein n=1 Tax=Leptothoe kymatousa TAU-MAC 1615 TaxID=2364775 RepID=A0ABS5Y1B5_9CYAN|nr:DUF4058 family protein [Leptothoe kymatousa]MBT9311591.1 DUF4058 family protein [Leptothoe kymatousa TAU-MAC 1615]
MKNPFPGMNPYLEHSALWHQVHNRLIVAIADAITPQVAPKYRVSIEERIYTSVEEGLLVGIADVAVGSSQAKTPTQTMATATKPIPVQVPVPAEVTERFLEVRLTQSGDIVCVIEVLSPKNKRSGTGRETYQTKRQKILQSQTNLIEIDLLRVGEPMPVLATIEAPYRILVSRGHSRPAADLYAFGLTEPLPNIPIPLLTDDAEPVVELQDVLNDIYTRARFDLSIDYTQPLKPSLPEAENIWIQGILSGIDP